MNALPATRADLRPQPTAMAEALRNLQQVLEQCRDAVFLASAEGVITRVNPAFEKLTGYTSNEIVGRDLSLITENGAASPQYQKLWRSLFEGKQFSGGHQLKTKSGESCAIELIVTPVHGGQQRMVSLVGTALATAEPEEQATTPDISRMLHDLRNMLLVVIAHAELALDTLPGEHPARRHVESSKTAAQNAAALAHEFTRDSSPTGEETGNASHCSRTGDRRTTFGEQVEELSRASEPGAAKLATVLFVEDESLVLDSSVEFLKKAGYGVISAATGGAAVELAQSYPGRIDLLITDMVLPQVSGPELAQSITASHPETKVLAISGHPQNYVLQQPGIAYYLAKPFSFSELEEKIRSVLYNKKPALGLGAP